MQYPKMLLLLQKPLHILLQFADSYILAVRVYLYDF